MLQNTIKYTIEKELVQLPPLSNNPTLLPIHQKIIAKLDYFHQKNKIPHIIFHGSSGSGKRTIVDQFLHKIYQGDKHKIKSNVMIVNCAQGKGIKFIREELKFFAKTNIQSNNGTIFKTIVLINADYLTIDAQSALRRCIELFSYNTRFFILVENKNKLLNPILSRFCEIYVPEYVEQGKIINLHQFSIQRNFKITLTHQQEEILKKTMQYLSDNKEKIDQTLPGAKHPSSSADNPLRGLSKDDLGFEPPVGFSKPSELVVGLNRSLDHRDLVKVASDFYEEGLSTLDIIHWLESSNEIDPLHRSTYCICYDNIKSEYRCEKLLMLYMLDFIFLRSDKDVKCVLQI